MNQPINDLLASGVRVEYPLYNVCYALKDGMKKTIKERATLKESITAMKKFDREFCSQGKVVENVASVFFEPVREARIPETKQIVSL